jgi:hypothetical protein
MKKISPHVCLNRVPPTGNSGIQEETRILDSRFRTECQSQKLPGLRTEESILHTHQNIPTHSAVESVFTFE